MIRYNKAKMKLASSGLFISVLLSLILSCSQQESTCLFPGIYSGTELNDFLENDSLQVRDVIQFVDDEVKVAHVSDLTYGDISGISKVIFFRNRLKEIVFYPYGMNKALSELKLREGIDFFKTSSNFYDKGKVRVSTGVDQFGAYISWAESGWVSEN